MTKVVNESKSSLLIAVLIVTLGLTACSLKKQPDEIPPVVNDELTMTFRSGWGNIYFDIYFSGSTPPEEPPFPYWILGLKKWWMMKY